MSAITRLGVLTGGGDAPGLNAVIRRRQDGVQQRHRMRGLEDSFDGLIEPNRSRPLTPHDVTGILRLGGTILGTEGLVKLMPTARGGKARATPDSRQRVSAIPSKLVEMCVVDDVDRHRAGEPSQLTGAGVWHEGDPAYGQNVPVGCDGHCGRS